MSVTDARPQRGTVTSVRLADEPLFSSVWLRPSRVLYKQEGAAGGDDVAWDIVESWDAVGILLYHRDRNAFLAVRQFRPAVWASRSRALQSGFVPTASSDSSAAGTVASTVGGRPSPSTAVADATEGFTLELCGGLVNKAGKTLAEHAAEEVLEETGYKVEADALVPLFCMTEAVGLLGTSLHVFFAEVSDACRVSDGGGLEGENEVVATTEIDADGALDFLAATQAAGTPVSGDLLHALLLMTLPQPVRSRLLDAAAAAFVNAGRAPAPGASPSASIASATGNGAVIVPSRAARAAAAASFASEAASTPAAGAAAFEALLARGGYRIVRVAGDDAARSSGSGSGSAAAETRHVTSPPTSPVVLLSSEASAAGSLRSSGMRTGSVGSSSGVEVSSAGNDGTSSGATTSSAAGAQTGETAGGLVNWLKRLVGRAPAAPAPGTSVTAPASSSSTAPGALSNDDAALRGSAFATGALGGGSGSGSGSSSMSGSGFLAPSVGRMSHLGSSSVTGVGTAAGGAGSLEAMDASALLQEMAASRGSHAASRMATSSAAGNNSSSSSNSRGADDGSGAAWATAHGTDAAALEQVLARSSSGSVHLDGEANQLARLAPSPAASQHLSSSAASVPRGHHAALRLSQSRPAGAAIAPCGTAPPVVAAAARASFFAELRRAARELPILALYDAYPSPAPSSDADAVGAGAVDAGASLAAQLQSEQHSADLGTVPAPAAAAAAAAASCRAAAQEPSPSTSTALATSADGGAIVLRLSPAKVTVVALAAAGLLALGFLAGRWHAKRAAAAAAAANSAVAGSSSGAAAAAALSEAAAALSGGNSVSLAGTRPASGPSSNDSGSGKGISRVTGWLPLPWGSDTTSVAAVAAVTPFAAAAAADAADAALGTPASTSAFTPAALDKAALHGMSPAEIRAAAVAIDAAHAAASPAVAVTPVVAPPNSVLLETPVEMSAANAAGRVTQLLAAVRATLDDWWRQVSG